MSRSLPVLCLVVIALALTPADARADSKGKGKDRAKAPVVQASIKQAPAPAPTVQAQARTASIAPAPSVSESSLAQEAGAQTAASQSPASSGTMTTEEARSLITAGAQSAPAELTSPPVAAPESLPLTLRPTPAPAHHPAGASQRASIEPEQLSLTPPAWPVLTLLFLSAPAVALTILCVRRAGPLVRFLSV